jgi:isopentenyl phosphate kinase
VAKLGGSVITDKSKPFTYRSDVVSALAEEIASSGEKVVVVHGGGSYGHTVAKEHGLNSGTTTESSAGVAQTRASMYDLNHLVCKTMMEFKVSPYPFSPFDLVSRAPRSASALWLKGLLKSGLTPVTFGDVALTNTGFRILSGDEIVAELARTLRPDRCIFALDVDGVYEENTKVIIPELTHLKIRRMKVQKGDDATGGMKAKLDIAAKVAAGGTPVSFVSGYRRNEFSKALRGMDFYGTVVRR